MDKRWYLLPVVLIVFGLIAFSVLDLKDEGSGESGQVSDLEPPQWTISVTGFVDRPVNLTLEDIVSLPEVTVRANLICVGMPHTPLAEGNWMGARLRDVLETAGVSTGAVKVAFHAIDGFTTDLTLEDAYRDDIIVSYAKDGSPLEKTVRLVVPGKWGYKWIRELTTIELVDYDFKGYYESRGYTDSAEISEGDEVTGRSWPTLSGLVKFETCERRGAGS